MTTTTQQRDRTRRSTRRRLVKSISVALAATSAVVAIAGPSHASADSPAPTGYQRKTYIFTSPGEEHQIVLPGWAQLAHITVIGAGGGSTCVDGGAGTAVLGSVPLDGYNIFTVGVGGKGANDYSAGGGEYRVAGGWGADGAGGGEGVAKFETGSIASGGGASTVILDGVEIVVAGGGGGAGHCALTVAAGEGGIGGTNGRGSDGEDSGVSDGGAGGDMGTQTGRTGGSSSELGGGGGGGSRGGAAGAKGDYHVLTQAGSGGGGSGSSYVDPTVSGASVLPEVNVAADGYIAIVVEGISET